MIYSILKKMYTMKTLIDSDKKTKQKKTKERGCILKETKLSGLSFREKENIYYGNFIYKDKSANCVNISTSVSNLENVEKIAAN